MKKCYVFLAEGFEETEAVGIIDILRRGQLVVEVVSISDNKIVRGAHQIDILADSLFSENDFEDAQMLILPGGMPGTTNLNNFEPLKQLLKQFEAAQKPLAAICAAPLVFGGLGILRDKNAICYPGCEDKLLGATIVNEKVVVSGNVITSLGVVSVVEFGIAIVRKLQGDEMADRVAAALLVL
jgi:4-methyl-5(b-hydroxyethyl)-thiazole monophosphate biosynthesis